MAIFNIFSQMKEQNQNWFEIFTTLVNSAKHEYSESFARLKLSVLALFAFAYVGTASVLAISGLQVRIEWGSISITNDVVYAMGGLLIIYFMYNIGSSHSGDH